MINNCRLALVCHGPLFSWLSLGAFYSSIGCIGSGRSRIALKFAPYQLIPSLPEAINALLPWITRAFQLSY
jgi:hypothetical protein